MRAYPVEPQTAEYEVKAAFLFNFAKFVDWPAQAFATPNASFTICLDGDPFGGALDRIIQGENLEGRALTVRRLNSGNDLAGCQIVYVAASQFRHVDEIVSGANNHPILTVGDTDNFIDRGGIIRFIKSGGRIHFQINPDAAGRAGLQLSSKLLRLAEIVRPGAGGGGQ